MRRPDLRTLVTAAALIAAGAVVPLAADQASAQTGAARPDGATQYRDPAQAGRPTVAVEGMLTPIEAEKPGMPDGWGLETADGAFVPVSFDAGELGDNPDSPEGARRFSGRLAVSPALGRRLNARGVTVRDRSDSDDADGRRVLAAASRSGQPLPVSSATVEPATARTTTTSSEHRMYVAVINNRGRLDSASTIKSQAEAIRKYWTTESDGLIGSFTQPSATVSYSSSVAPSTGSGCGLGDPSAVWNEAAGKFRGVNFNLDGNHLVVLVSAACNGRYGAGIATIGDGLNSGGRAIISLGEGGVQIGVHEIGHNLALQHANAERCTPSCSTVGYMGIYSIMGIAITGGGWSPPALDTAYRVQDGVAGDGEVSTVTDSGSVTLAGRGTGSGVRGLDVTDPGTGKRYVVEYRSGAGRDSNAFYAEGMTVNGYLYRPGVVVERIERDRSTTLITRVSGNTTYTSYRSGERVRLGGITLDVGSMASASGASVTVTMPGDTPPAPSTFTATNPTVSGTARVGERLTAKPGAWTPAPSRMSYQWYANGRAVSRATGATFTPAGELRGARITVRVTGSRDGYTTASRTSASTAPLASGRFRTATPSVSGSARVGSTVGVKTGTWSPKPRFAYRWYADGRAISKATGSTMRITKSLRGKRISVQVSGSRTGYTTAARSSGSTGRVR